jgi:hypothetical protein
MSAPAGLSIVVTENENVAIEPPVTNYQVLILTDGGSWHESFGSAEQLEAFKLGLKAGCALHNHHLADQDIEHFRDTVPE